MPFQQLSIEEGDGEGRGLACMYAGPSSLTIATRTARASSRVLGSRSASRLHTPCRTLGICHRSVSTGSTRTSFTTASATGARTVALSCSHTNNGTDPPVRSKA